MDHIGRGRARNRLAARIKLHGHSVSRHSAVDLRFRGVVELTARNRPRKTFRHAGTNELRHVSSLLLVPVSVEAFLKGFLALRSRIDETRDRVATRTVRLDSGLKGDV